MEKPREDCIFCNILEGKAPGYVVYENEQAVALLDIQPYARGHCLIVSRRHVPWWHDLSAEESLSLFALARETAQKIMQTFKPEFISLYARGRRIPHTHIFLVPTNKGEPFDRHFNALEGFQEAAQFLADLREPAELKATLDLLTAGKSQKPGRSKRRPVGVRQKATFSNAVDQAVGSWAGYEDLPDTQKYIRKLRKSRRLDRINK